MLTYLVAIEHERSYSFISHVINREMLPTNSNFYRFFDLDYMFLSLDLLFVRLFYLLLAVVS